MGAVWLTLISLGASSAVGLSAPAQAAVTMCQGEQATIVGSGQGTLRGTNGDDVIVSNGSDVDAEDGDDLICLTSPLKGKAAFTYVYAGDGDDSVVVKTGDRARETRNSVDLGDGDDTFVGGSGVDFVFWAAGDGHDVIDTREGDDVVDLPLEPGYLLEDEIHLGAGSDYLEGEATGMTDDAVLDGGGDVHLTLFVPEGAWSLDNKTGRATVDGDVRFRWSGITGFDWQPAGSDATVAFVGSGADESINADLVSADMGGGDDLVSANSGVTDVTGAVADLKGGRGRDEIVLRRSFSRGANAQLVVDVSAQEARTGLGEVLAHLTAFERYGGVSSGSAVTVLGTGGADVLSGSGCALIIKGGRGDDRIAAKDSAGPDDNCTGAQQPYLLLGGSGDDTFVGQSVALKVEGGQGDDVVHGSRKDDVLRGQGGVDVLIGGRGEDVVYGGQGRDRCEAERTVACER